MIFVPRNSDRPPRVQAHFSREEIAAVDDFRFRHRMSTRAAAVREILKIGLADAEKTLRNLEGDG